METIRLTPRLLTVARLAGYGNILADVGTDHAYLPCYLLGEGKFQKAIAADIAPGPLQNARKTVEALGLSDRVSLRLCPGLDGIEEGEADVVAVAGMGGEMIASIVLIEKKFPLYVLQPMSTEERLRKSLAEGGFWIEKEALTREGARVYTALRARYDGRIRTYSDAKYYLGRVYLDNPPEIARDYMNKKKLALRKSMEGNHESGHYEEAGRVERILREVEDYEKQF